MLEGEVAVMSARSNKKVGVLELDAPADPTQVAPKTVAPNSPNTGPPQQVVDEQALIEEARRRQRRRRHRVAVACVAVAIIGALIYVVGGGGGGTPLGTRPPGRAVRLLPPLRHAGKSGPQTHFLADPQSTRS